MHSTIYTNVSIIHGYAWLGYNNRATVLILVYYVDCR